MTEGLHLKLLLYVTPQEAKHRANAVDNIGQGKNGEKLFAEIHLNLCSINYFKT
jgi:hypothetical protein